MKKILYQFASSKNFIHYLFWLVLTIQLSIDTWHMTKQGVGVFALNLTLRIAVLLCLVYGNLLLLIPRFFNQKRFGLYFLTVLGLIAFYTFFSLIVLDQYVCDSINDWKKECSFIGEAGQYFFIALRYLITSFLFNLIQEQYEQKQKMAAIQLEKMQSDLSYLRAQINPHFLFNTFNNLYGLALSKSDKTPEIILKLSDMMDYMLYESNEMEVSLEKDVANLQNYIDIERIRQGNNAKIAFHIDGVMVGRKIAPLLFLPLVENAFKHGVNNVIDNAFLQGHLSIDATTILFQLQNNMPKNKGQNGHLNRGIGLENLKKRLDLTYPNRYSLETKVENDIFYTSLKINLIP